MIDLNNMEEKQEREFFDFIKNFSDKIEEDDDIVLYRFLNLHPDDSKRFKEFRTKKIFMIPSAKGSTHIAVTKDNVDSYSRGKTFGNENLMDYYILDPFKFKDFRLVWHA